MSSSFFRVWMVKIGVAALAVLSAFAGPLSASDIEILRRDRQLKMPYLDSAIIAEEIHADTIEEKELFLSTGDKTLQELIGRAVEVHTPARAARERISLAKRRILVALRTLFPEAEMELVDRSGNLSTQIFHSFSYRFKFRQPLFRGGILWNTLLQEKTNYESALKEYDVTVGDLIQEVGKAYVEYHRALQVVKGQEKAVETAEKSAGVSQEKFKAQIISEIEHLNVQSLFGQMQYDYETSKQELELAKLDLQNFLGLRSEDEFTVAPLYDIEDLLDRGKVESGDAEEAVAAILKENRIMPVLPDLVDKAYLHRPELQVEAAKLESARLEERIRWGNMIPQADAILEFGKLAEAFDEDSLHPGFRREFRFSLEFNWNLGGNRVGYVFENDERAPSVSQFQGGTGSDTHRNTMTLGVLNSLQDYAEAKEAEVDRLDQVTQLEIKEKEVIQDVKQSYYDFQKARIQVKSSLQRVDYRKRLVLLSKHKLEKNEVQISEYIQSEIDLLQEVATLHQALADYLSAKAALNHALGIRDYFPIEALHARSTQS